MGTLELSTDQTLYSCGQCRGVFTDQLRRQEHRSRCDGTVRASDAVTFLCERRYYLRICDDIFQLSAPLTTGRRRGRPRKNPTITDQPTGRGSDVRGDDNDVTTVKMTSSNSHTEHNYVMSRTERPAAETSLTNPPPASPVAIDTGDTPSNNIRKSRRSLKPKSDPDYVAMDTGADAGIQEEEDGADLDWQLPASPGSPTPGSPVPGRKRGYKRKSPDDGAPTLTVEQCQQFIKKNARSTRRGQTVKFECPKCKLVFDKIDRFRSHYGGCDVTKKPARDKEWKRACAEKYAHLVAEVGEGAEKKTVYVCDVCKKVLHSAGMMERHMASTHSQVWQCNICEETFQNRSKLSMHMDKHIKPHMCEFCSERFSQKKDMIRHTWIHTGEYPYKCTECDYKSRFNKALQQHMRSHTGALIRCEVEGCNFVTQWTGAYAAHKAAKHAEQTRFCCSQCDYKTNAKGCYDKHLKVHLGLKNFKCSMCPYKAIQKSDIIKHIKKRHMKQKSYFCDRCMFSTSYSHGFRVHMMQHMGVKPWQCSLCGYNSITKQKLLRHLQNRHPEQEGECINLGLKLDIKFSQYCRPVTSETKTQDVSFTEHEGTVEIHQPQEGEEGEGQSPGAATHGQDGGEEGEVRYVTHGQDGGEEGEVRYVAHGQDGGEEGEVRYVTHGQDGGEEGEVRYVTPCPREGLVQEEGVHYITQEIASEDVPETGEEEISNTVKYVTSDGQDAKVVYIVGGDSSIGDGTTEGSSEGVIQIQTEDGTILHIPDLASLPQIADAVNSTQTLVITQKQAD